MQNNEFIGGLVGEQLDKVSNSITDGIVNSFLVILETLVEIGYWACSVGILISVLMFICTKDPKSVTNGFKFGFVLIIIILIRSAYEK